jgi:diguanylate cyclase (GGDEF)-like protein
LASCRAGTAVRGEAIKRDESMSEGRILAVDDEHFFRVLYEDLLGGEGYDVTTAEDGAKALDLLERESFDVTILDVIMPGEDGERIKDRWPSMEILFVTSLRDVKVAATAMQRGASDFLTKPLNPDELLAVVARLFERRAVAEEHSRLLDENIFFLDSLGVYQRGVRILEKLDLDGVGDAILERLMAETSAQGGVLWLSTEDNADRLRLHSVRGLVVADQEPKEISWSKHPHAASFERGLPFAVVEPEENSGDSDHLKLRNTLFVPFGEGRAPVLLAKLNEKVGGNQFDDVDLRKSRILESLAFTGIRNARAHNRLAQRSLKDAQTQAYEMEFFKSFLLAELQKSDRFHRSLSLLALRIANFRELQKSYQAPALRQHADAVVRSVAGAIRDIDLIGRPQEDEFYVLLPETDYLGSLILKRRISEALSESRTNGPAPLSVVVSSATFPRDGRTLKQLFYALKTRLMREQMNLYTRRGLSARSHWEVVSTLLASEKPPFPERERRGIRPEHASIRKGVFEEAFFLRLQEALLEEVERDPAARGLAYLGIGDLHARQPALAARAPEGEPATRIFALGVRDHLIDSITQHENTWVTCLPIDDERLSQHRFVLFLTEETAYAFYARRTEKGLQGFHTSDTGLVENLIFKLQREYDLQSQL